MRSFLIISLLFSVLGVNGQVTPNPKIKKKSTNDVFINKLEITDTETIVSMQFVSKTAENQLKEYFDQNPKEKEKFGQMNPMMRNLMLQQMMMGTTASTISFQPSSFLKVGDGKKYKFIKAENIPTAPDRKDAEPGKKYFFKVYFEKLPKGYEIIDLIESDLDVNEGMTYWNFIGISIVNPAEGKETKTLATKSTESISNFKLYGKVLDLDSNKPLAAKIVCYDAKTKEKIDSMRTSRSGYYEFLVNNEDIIFTIESDGHNSLEENFGLGPFVSKGSFEKDIYLETAMVLDTKKEEALVKEPVVEPISEPKKKDLGEAIDKVAFKLDKVYFNLGQANVLPDSYTQLDALADHLKENPDLKIQIEGHTDKIGDPKANKKLSLDRAYNVRQYLVNKGIAGERIKFLGLGDTMPVSKGNDEESRSKNRRVEYKIIE